MTLYIAKKDPMANYTFETTTAQHNLLTISKFDMGLGEGNPIYIDGVECLPVIYNKTISGAPQDRLNVLINNSGVDHGQATSIFSSPHIIIAPVRNGYTLNDGITVIQNALTLPPWISDQRNPFNHYCIYYNVQACASDNYQMWVKDTGGGTIPTDTALCLYHELSRCFQYIVNGVPLSSEMQATTDENDMRDMQGAPHRDVNNPGFGCGVAVPGVGVGPTPPCFVGTTPILTPEGWRPIAELRAGDRIISYHKSTGTTRIRHVKQQRCFEPARIWELHLAGRAEPIGTTRIHSFLTNRGWKQTKQLKSGDILVTSGKEDALVTSVVETSRREPVYSLITDGEHTYIAQGCVVHNFTYLRHLRIWWHRYVLTNGIGETKNPAEVS
jgi:hypothetical protein